MLNRTIDLSDSVRYCQIRVVAVESSYLSKLFKDETAERLSDYITAVRLEKAKQILSSSGARIQDVASHVGYDDYRYFCTVFKKSTGVTPLQYRVKSV